MVIDVESKVDEQAGILVIIPCGQKKIWDTSLRSGPTAAKDAYTGSPFSVNRSFAEKFSDRWVILSAKYGFIDPDFVIPCQYDVTFKKRNRASVSYEQLRKQVRQKKFKRF